MFPHSQLRRTGWTRRPAKGCPVTHTVRVNKALLCVPALLWDQAANNTLNGPDTLWLLQTGCLQSELGLSTERPLWNLFPVAPHPEKNAPYLTSRVTSGLAIPGRILGLSGPYLQLSHQEHGPVNPRMHPSTKTHKPASSGSFLCFAWPPAHCL